MESFVLTELQSRYGREDEVLLQHSQSQLDLLQSTIEMSLQERMDLAKKCEDVYFNQVGQLQLQNSV